MHGPMHGPMPPIGMPEPDIEGVDELSRRVYSALRTTMMLQKRLMLKMLEGQDAHPAQALCLGMLAQSDGMSQSEIATTMHVSRPTVTAMLQRLEGAGIIERRDDEADQRVTRVFLTDEGRRIAKAMREVHAHAVELSVGWMSERDRTELVRLLDAMNEHVRAAAEGETEGEVRP